MQDAALGQEIRAEALALGFGDCRFCAAADADTGQVAALTNWLDSGMNGTMNWFGRSKEARISPASRFPWAKSVIVLRFDYGSLVTAGRAGTGEVMPRIARYAQGLDYHEVLRPKLVRLEQFVRGLRPDTEARWYMDTGPVLEHVHAARAGVGWTGKHTLTLNEHSGSYFFLAEILTSLELPPDSPAIDHCGTCTACIDACPTEAIVAPYVLDARRCISYLTIEHRGLIEDEFRGQLNGYLFGCDICQEVCPHVRKQIEREGPRPMTDDFRHPPIEGLTVLEVLKFSDKRLMATVAGTPMERTGEARLRRNAALLVGEERLVEGLPGLAQAIMHTDPVVREACIWALGQFAGTGSAAAARKILSTHQKRESEESLREKVIEALQKLVGDDGRLVPVVEVPTEVRTVERQGRPAAGGDGPEEPEE